MAAISYSGLTMFEKCPRSFQLKYIIKHPEPEFVGSPAMERGSRLHQAAEDYVNQEIQELPKDLKGKEGFFDRMIELGSAQPELEFNLTEDWQSIPFVQKEDGFIRGIIDMVLPQGDLLEIMEYKTGKVYDTHVDQRSLYSMAGLVMFPEAKVCRTTTVYFDLGGADKTTTVERENLETLKWSWTRRVNKTKPVGQPYPMRPGFQCKWCSFSKKKGGPCPN